MAFSNAIGISFGVLLIRANLDELENMALTISYVCIQYRIPSVGFNNEPETKALTMNMQTFVVTILSLCTYAQPL